MLNLKFFCVVPLAACCLLLTGCPSDNGLGQVQGVITIDGEPADRATVRFYPTTGRGSFGVSDAEGRYELKYTVRKDGAIVGNHKVTVSMAVNPDFSMETREEISPGRKESLPAKYYDRRKTELTADVTSGSNEINFDVSTK